METHNENTDTGQPSLSKTPTNKARVSQRNLRWVLKKLFCHASDAKLAMVDKNS